MYVILYLQSHGRRPIRLHPLMPWEDAQAAVPVGWCGCCGGEIYEGNGKFCLECEKERKHETN